MSQRQFERISSYFASINDLRLAKSTVTQGTSLTTGVALNGNAGSITTVSTALATRGSAKFTVSNPRVKADSIVVANVIGYTGTQGIPLAQITNVTDGNFQVNIRNLDDTDTLNGSLKIGFGLF